MKKVYFALSVFFLMNLLVMVVHAQEALTETFTAADGSFSIMYPTDWTANDVAGSLAFYSDPRLEAEFPSVSGDMAINMFSNEILTSEVIDAANIHDAVIAMGANLPSQDVVDFTVSDHPAARVTFETPDFDGEIIGVDYGDGQRIIMFGITTKGDVALLDQVMQSMLETLQYGEGAASTPAVEATDTGAAPIMPVVNGVSEIVLPGVDGGRTNLFITDPQGQAVRQLTHEQLTALLPSWSPDGTMIAYISNTSTNGTDAYDVFVIPSSGGESRQISLESSTDRGAIAWSPDSQQLIFVSTRDPGIGAQIYKADADGSNEEKLTIDAKAINGFTLDWSPDGQHIAFIAFPNAGPDYALLFADADGSNLTPIPNIPIIQVGEYFKWSPDGQYALLSDTKSLIVMAADGSAPEIIFDAAASNLNISGVSWSPDGTQIAFTAYGGDGTPFLYTINADGSNQQKIVLDGQEVIWGGLSWGILPAA